MSDYSAELDAVERLRAMGATRISVGVISAEFPPLVTAQQEHETPRLTTEERAQLEELRELRQMAEELGRV